MLTTALPDNGLQLYCTYHSNSQSSCWQRNTHMVLTSV